MKECATRSHIFSETHSCYAMPVPEYSEDDYKRAVGHVLKKLRKRAKLSQEVASAEVGIDRTHLSRIENGEHVTSGFVLASLAGLYECEIGELHRKIAHRAGIYHERPRKA